MLHYLEQRCINKNFKIRVAQGYYRTFKKPRSIKDRVAQGSVAQGPPVPTYVISYNFSAFFHMFNQL